MKTSDFIDALVADRRPEAAPGAALARWLIVACVVSGAALLASAGVRDDLAAAASTPRVLFKWLLVGTLACVSTGASLRLARPGLSPGAWGTGLFAVAAVMVAGIATELALLPRAQWAIQARGANATWCLRMIPLLAAAPLAAALLAARAGATTRPTLAGAMAGLLAGAVGASLYALHCTDDSPLFVACWYTLGIAVVVGIGAALGRRLLRW